MRAVLRDLGQAMIDLVTLHLVMSMVALGTEIMLLMVERVAMRAIIGAGTGDRQGEQGKGEEADQTLRHQANSLRLDFAR